MFAVENVIGIVYYCTACQCPLLVK